MEKEEKITLINNVEQESDERLEVGAEPRRSRLSSLWQESDTLLGAFVALPISEKAKLAGIVICSCTLSQVISLLTHLNANSYFSFDVFPAGLLTPLQGVAMTMCALAILLYILATANLITGFEAAQPQIHASAEFSIYVLFIFLCDRTSIIPRRDKDFNPDFFWFLILALFGAGLCTLTKAKPPPPPLTPQVAPEPEDATSVPIVMQEADPPRTFHVAHLNRNQTEEWKGWMQVIFLWYHYFDNKKIYNAIRLFIASYVWMTGFGNFSYYYIKEDFSFSRFCQMQWRLNFFVICVCLIMRNEYMLYYICPLHTLFTVMIFFVLKFRHGMNRTNRGVAIKFSGVFVLALILWDFWFSTALFSYLWYPLKWLVRYDDPYRPTRDVMSEWFFRSKLDHLVWILGMLNAYTHPNVDAFLVSLDNKRPLHGRAIKVCIVSATLLIFYLYYIFVFSRKKNEYNTVHPFTSFVPILAFLVLRNISKRARMYHVHLFEFLGKITLETYITQFHIWMGTTGINGSPKQLLKILPGDFPMCDFVLASVVTTAVSFRLFHTSNVVRTVVIPSKASNSVILQNIALVLVFCAAIFLWHWRFMWYF